MKTLFKFIGYLISVVITLLVVAVVILKLIPDDQYSDWITTAAESATGRDVSIEALELDFGTALRVRADKLRIANADWAGKDDMLNVDRLEADFGLLSLLEGKADIRAVVERADVRVENDAEGNSNWAMGAGKAEPATEEPDEGQSEDFQGLPIHPYIREIRIDDFRLTQVTGPDVDAKVSHLKQLLIETPEQDTTLSLAADLDGRPITLTGNLGDMEKFLNKSSEPLQLSGDINGNQLEVSGNWGPLFPAQVMQIDVALNIPATASLAKLVGLDIEEFEDINITGKIVGDGNTLALDPLVINLDDPTAKLSVTGSVADLKSMSGINITTDANTASLKTLLRQLGIELATELPPEIEMSADVKGGLDELALSELVVIARDEGMEIKATTTIGDLLNVNKINLNVTGNVDSLSKLSKYAQTELPDTDPLILTATLAEDESAPLALKLHAETGGVNVNVNSALESLAVPDSLDLGVSVTAASMANFNKLTQMEFHDLGPLDLNANLQLAKGNVAINDLVLKLKDQTAKGNLALKLPESENQPTALNGKVNIDYLNLNHLLPMAEEEPAEGEAASPAVAEAPAAESSPEVESERLFSSEPFLREQLHAYDVDLKLNADKFEFGKAVMNNVQLAVLLKEGLLDIEPIKATGSTGNINGVVRIDGRQEIPDLDVDLSILQMPMPNLGGALDFDVDLDGKGDSVAALMGSLNGQMLLVVRDGKLEGRMVKKFGSGLLSFSKDKDYTTLECGILRVDIKDGLANFDDKLAAQLTEVTWKGGGEINLKTEELDAGISPKPRKGIPISAGGLAGLVHVGGTLKNPSVQLDPKDVAVKYAKYSTHVATGGITYIAEKIKDKIDANKDVCEMILEGTVFEEADKAREKEEKEAAKAEEQADNAGD
jgi:uncharacterized protein involved in outer membrane biogenesis